MIQMSSLACPGGIQGLADPLHPALRVRDGPVRLERGVRRGQDHVGDRGGVRHHDVLHDQGVEVLQQLPGVVGVRLGVHGVLADDVDARELTTVHRLEHVAQVPAVARDDRPAPRRLEPRPSRGVLYDVLEARQLVRDRAHVAPALDVVLAAQRIQPAAVDAHVPGQQAQVDERHDVVDGVVVLGDPEGPADHGAVGLRVGVRDLADHAGRHAGHGRAALERPVGHALGVGLEVLGGTRDERVVLQVVRDDLAGDRVRQGDVRAHVDTEPEIAERRRLGPARVDDDQPRPALDPAQDVVEEDGVRRAGVRAPQQHEVGVLDLLV